jgi:hypothetical protein
LANESDVAFLAFRWDSQPKKKNNRETAKRPPTTASPAMTPELKPLPSSVEPEVVELEVPSMTLCLTHSPKEHELSVSPFDPNN